MCVCGGGGGGGGGGWRVVHSVYNGIMIKSIALHMMIHFSIFQLKLLNVFSCLSMKRLLRIHIKNVSTRLSPFHYK